MQRATTNVDYNEDEAVRDVAVEEDVSETEWQCITDNGICSNDHNTSTTKKRCKVMFCDGYSSHYYTYSTRNGSSHGWWFIDSNGLISIVPNCHPSSMSSVIDSSSLVSQPHEWPSYGGDGREVMSPFKGPPTTNLLCSETARHQCRCRRLSTDARASPERLVDPSGTRFLWQRRKFAEETSGKQLGVQVGYFLPSAGIVTHCQHGGAVWAPIWQDKSASPALFLRRSELRGVDPRSLGCERRSRARTDPLAVPTGGVMDRVMHSLSPSATVRDSTLVGGPAAAEGRTPEQMDPREHLPHTPATGGQQRHIRTSVLLRGSTPRGGGGGSQNASPQSGTLRAGCRPSVAKFTPLALYI